MTSTPDRPTEFEFWRRLATTAGTAAAIVTILHLVNHFVGVPLLDGQIPSHGRVLGMSFQGSFLLLIGGTLTFCFIGVCCTLASAATGAAIAFLFDRSYGGPSYSVAFVLGTLLGSALTLHALHWPYGRHALVVVTVTNAAAWGLLALARPKNTCST